jgi:hypothetical protein
VIRQDSSRAEGSRTRRTGLWVANGAAASALILVGLWPRPVDEIEGGGATCALVGPGTPLPSEVRESSGVVPRSGSTTEFWTHNDSGGRPELFLVDVEGHGLARVRVNGASLVDWEDLGKGPCPGSEAAEASSCLYIADTGDNLERRSDPTLYRIPEPQASDSVSAPADRFRLRFPEGPRDVEAIYVLPGERVFLVTKGRSGPVEVYRVPPLFGPQPLLLERIQMLMDRPTRPLDGITGGSADPSGRWVFLRSYETLFAFHPDSEGRLHPAAPPRVDLRSLRERQGEGVAWVDEGRWVLTSEAGLFRGPGTLYRIECPHWQP